VRAPIVELTPQKLSDESVRKRFRWLSHLPQVTEHVELIASNCL
jgi:hypothetical protein